MITLTGLSDRQMVLCEIMWSLQSQEEVTQFITALPLADAQECRSLVQLMLAEIIDSVDSVDDASAVLVDIMRK